MEVELLIVSCESSDAGSSKKLVGEIAPRLAFHCKCSRTRHNKNANCHENNQKDINEIFKMC